MTRREILGALVAILAVALGRIARRALLLDPAGAWREPGWLESRLPPLPEAVPPDAPTGPRLPSEPLDPNTCPADSLELLPGIGPALAGRIAAARAAGVHFACARDMQVIRGIGPRLAAKIEPYLTFGQGDTATTDPMRSAR